MEALSISTQAAPIPFARLDTKSAPARLLIISSSEDLDGLREAMAGQPWLVEHAKSASEASRLMRSISFDAAMIDPNLPDQADLHWLPSAGIPIIVISNPAGGDELLSALMPRAADFIFKPFCGPELVARVKKVLGQLPSHPRSYHSASFYLDSEQRCCTVFNRSVQLTSHENSLLTALLDSPRQFCTNRQLVESIWGQARAVETQNLRVLVAQLRKKIERQPSQPEILLTVFGVGYRLLLP